MSEQRTQTQPYRHNPVDDPPLMLDQPMNIIVFLMFYSPIIIVVFVLSMSFLFKNFKGLIYLAFLIFLAFLRSQIISFTLGKDNKEVRSSVPICRMTQYSQYGNAGFSIFVISFTLMYLCFPMFINGDINYMVFGGLLAYLIMDIAIRNTYKCITSLKNIFFNVITGACIGSFIPFLFYSMGGSGFMFFNEMSSNKEVCSMPKKQTFKCNVYKNGELVTTTSG
jgi:hypothetical protein